MQFTNCTTRKPLFHDPYESYGSSTCIYTPSPSNYMQFTNCTTRKPLFHDPCESWTCIYILSAPIICSSQTVRLVNHSFTTRTTRTSRTGRGLVCSTDVQFTNCTTRNPLFHDLYEWYESYETYESWTCIYTSSLYNDIQFTNCTTRKPLFHDQYDSYESNGSCEKEYAIIRVVSVRVYYIITQVIHGF